MDLLSKKGIRLTKKTRWVAEKSIEDYVPEEKNLKQDFKVAQIIFGL
jgi:hypothetical protein